MNYKNLPSLTAIRSFAVAARHLSFVRAARELGVQPPAVSRQVADLERALGVELFVRSKPRLRLTPRGQDLLSAVASGLDTIHQGCERVKRRDDDNRVSVITSIGITSCWLLSRLVDFYQQHPEIELELTTRDSTQNLDTLEADVAIVFGRDDLPGVGHTCIFRETMNTVCSPALLDGANALSVAELRGKPLLHYHHPAHRDDWQRLFESVGEAAPSPGPGMRFNSYIVYLQAAINGIGIAVGWEHYLDDFLADGRLVRASPLRLRTRRGYFCCLSQSGAEKPAALRFRDWICSLVPESD